MTELEELKIKVDQAEAEADYEAWRPFSSSISAYKAHNIYIKLRKTYLKRLKESKK